MPHTSLSLRPAVADDLALLCRLEHRVQSFPWTLQHWQDSLNDAASHIDLLVNNKNMPLAYAVWRRVLDEAELLNLAVHPDYRRLGLARRLLHSGLQCLAQTDVAVCFLEVRASNTGASALYMDTGWHLQGRRTNYYRCHDGQREDALLMCQHLRKL